MKHLLDTASLSREDAIGILDIAEEMTLVSEREVKKLPVLRGRTVVNLFFEDSTRTRLSFEAAAKRLSADVLNFSAKGSSVSKGESLQDTIQTISAMGADAIVVRHSGAGTAHRLAHTGWIDVPVVNAGDGTHEHPTQALLDAFTLRRALAGVPASGPVTDGPRGQGLDGAKVAIVGDVLHSRVARSNVHLLSGLGADVHLIAPATLPFILTAIRLGASVALTTLIAAESTGAQAGLGMRIRSLNNTFESAPMLAYVIVIGIIGITMEKIIKLLERKLTGWQEKREI